MAQEHKKEPRGIPKGTLPASAQQLLDDMVTGPMTPEAVQDAFMLLKKAFIERALGAELGHHLGYPSGQPKPESRRMVVATRMGPNGGCAKRSIFEGVEA